MIIPDLRVSPTIKTFHASVRLNCALHSYPWTFANNNGILHKLCLPYFTSRYTYCLLIYYAPRSCGGSTTNQNFRRFHHPDVTSDAEWFKMLFLITADGVILKADKEVVERSARIKDILKGRYLSLCLRSAASSSSPCPFLDTSRSNTSVSLPIVSSTVMKKVTYHSFNASMVIGDILLLGPHVLRIPPCGDYLCWLSSGGGQFRLRKAQVHISPWDREFLDVNLEFLFKILMAADYLAIKSLLWVNYHLTGTCFRLVLHPNSLSYIGCQKLMEVRRGETPEESTRILKALFELSAKQGVRISSLTKYFSDRSV